MNEVPNDPKEMIDYLVKSGWRISTWGINFSKKILTVRFEENKNE